MNTFTAFMEKHFVPFAAKIGSQKHLVAIRDGFISLMPVTMAGAFASLFNVFVRDIPNQIGWQFIPESAIGKFLISINGNVWWGAVCFFALGFTFTFAYHLSKAYDVNPLAGGVISFAAYLTTVSQTFNETWGGVGIGYMNATALFSALFITLLVTMIYIKLTKANIVIKMPDSVPPAVSKAFLSIIPGSVAIFTAAILGLVCTQFLGKPINDLIVEFVQTPFLSLAQNLVSVIVVTFAVQLFWFFGLHGTNVLGPVLDGIYKTALLENNTAHEAGKTMVHLWTRGSFDAYAWMGGAGCTIALIIALLIFSKKQDQKTVAKLSLPMGIFNINEPVTFGIPIVLNPVYFIPYLLIPTLLVIIGYTVTAIGLVPPVYIEIPWIVPPVLYAFLATGGSLMAAGVALINLIIAVVIWSAFVIIANRVKEN